ncbi:MAG: hypothetical protein IH628_04075, partial [Proteobacteria bacterium]|nr:hypothetical protein [Pseudomonadota bacterium]
MKPENHTIPRWMKVALALALLALLAGAAWFYHVQERVVRQGVENRLASIARLKSDHIATWRRERLADAAVLMGSPFLEQSVARFLAGPRGKNAEELRAQFHALQTYYSYADVLLADAEGQVRLSMSGRMETRSGYAPALAAALHDRKPVLTDLHAEAQHPIPHISVVAPLFTGVGRSRKPLGAVILVSDASRFLYPLIQSWPEPSRTGETLLVRRDGNDAFFL